MKNINNLFGDNWPLFLKELKTYMTEGSTLYERMNGVEGGQGLPKEFFMALEYYQSQGLTVENFDEFFAEQARLQTEASEDDEEAEDI